jgi:SsrA-binding protein
MAGSDPSGRVKVVVSNRRARRDYTILDTFEAGLALVGSEVKSLRAGKMQLKDSYAQVERGEAYLIGAHIAPYEFSREGGHDPERARKLLLHRREIDRIGGAIAEKGLTLIPLQVYFKDGKAKVELGLAKGKTTYDKRESLKARDHQREIAKGLHRHGR